MIHSIAQMHFEEKKEEEGEKKRFHYSSWSHAWLLQNTGTCEFSAKHSLHRNDTIIVLLLKFIISSISLVESQRGASTIQRCSIEIQKGAITIAFVQR